MKSAWFFNGLALTPFLISLFFFFAKRVPEKILRTINRGGLLVFWGFFIVFLGSLVVQGDFFATLFNFRSALWLKPPFEIHFRVDLPSFSIFSVSLLIFSTIVQFSATYLHREAGYARFFCNIWMFFFGWLIVLFSRELSDLFLGWEIVGFTSFLLIGFYQSRKSALRNALRVFSIYRLCDFGLLAALIVTHNYCANFEGIAGCVLNDNRALKIGLLLLLAAVGKSAQLIFSFWVPKALEGPTPSSAIFYAALSIHGGSFLLLTTHDLWSASLAVKVAIGATGLITAFLTSGFSRVQSNIKGQIGYASVAQVGLQFFEISLGLYDLALVHILVNASLRCYQLLTSSSILAQTLKDTKALKLITAQKRIESFYSASFRSSVYTFFLKEGGFSYFLQYFIWSPLLRFSKWFRFDRISLTWIALAVFVGKLIFGRFVFTESVTLFGSLVLFCLAWSAFSYSVDLAKTIWISLLFNAFTIFLTLKTTNAPYQILILSAGCLLLCAFAIVQKFFRLSFFKLNWVLILVMGAAPFTPQSYIEDDLLSIWLPRSTAIGTLIVLAHGLLSLSLARGWTKLFYRSAR